MSDYGIVEESNHLALMLAMNCTLALADKGLFLTSQASFCADKAEALAARLERESDPEKPVSPLAKDLHGLALLLRLSEKPEI